MNLLIGSYGKFLLFGAFARKVDIFLFALQLAEGLDKSRADCSFLIWNVVNSASSEYSSYGDKRHSSQGDSVVTKPLFELGKLGGGRGVIYENSYCGLR